MAANIVCYYNLAHKQRISKVLPVVINKIGKIDKTIRLSHRKYFTRLTNIYRPIETIFIAMM